MTTGSGYHEALVRQGNALRFSQVATEALHPGGLLIATSFVGVCGTDLQILNGTRPDTAQILGHEGVGFVVQAGSGAALPVGEPVVFNPSAQLGAGRIMGHNVPGLFQKLIALDSHAIEDGVVMSTRDRHPQVCAALVEPLAAVIYAHQLISNRVRDLRTVIIFGAGPVGLLATIYLTARGIHVLLAHSTEARLRTSLALGIVSPASALLVSEALREQAVALNGGHRLDAALICTTRGGAPAALRHAVEIVRDGGCIDLVTNYPESACAPCGIDAASMRQTRAENVNGLPREGRYLRADLSGRCVALTGHRGTSREHLDLALQAVSADPSAYGKLITHVVSLREAAQSIQSLSQSRARTLEGRDCIKLVIDMARCAAASASLQEVLSCPTHQPSS